MGVVDVMERYLKIHDADLMKCVGITNEWYALCSILKFELGIDEYSLWIGTLKWGDCQRYDVIAHLDGDDIYFVHNGERVHDLVSMVIHSWECGEPIDVIFNNAVGDGLYLLCVNNPDMVDVVDLCLHSAPYWFHDGKVKSL